MGKLRPDENELLQRGELPVDHRQGTAVLRPVPVSSGDDPRPDPPPLTEDENVKQARGGDEPTEKSPHWLEAALRKDTYTFRAEDLDIEPEAVRCLWGNYIVAGEVNLLSGPGGSGKSSLLTGLALAGATGQSFLGRPTREFDTVIFTTEDGVDDYKRKLHAWKFTYPAIWRQAEGRIHVVPLKGVPLRLIQADFGQVQVAPGIVEALAARTRELVPKGEVLILVETVSRVSGGDESNGGAGMLVVALERLSLLTNGGTPVPVAHVGKENARNRQVDMYAARGGSALPDNARSVLVLSPPPKDVLKRFGLPEDEEPDFCFVLAHAKHNRTPKEPDLLLRRESGRYAAYFEPWQKRTRVQPCAEETDEEARAGGGQLLRSVVRFALERDNRKHVTATMLRDEYLERLDGLAKNKVKAAVDRAVADHWLREGTDKVQGGGIPLFPDEPERLNPPGETRPEPAQTRPGGFEEAPSDPLGNRLARYKQRERAGGCSPDPPPKSPGSRPDGLVAQLLAQALPLVDAASDSTPAPATGPTDSSATEGSVAMEPPTRHLRTAANGERLCDEPECINRGLLRGAGRWLCGRHLASAAAGGVQ